MATKDNVQGVVLALFGASAGGHLAGLTASATANGLTAVAADLAASAGFILGKDLSTAAAFRDNMLTGLGISSTNSAYAAAAAWADGELAKAGANRGEIVATAVNFLAGLTDSTSPFFAAASAYRATVTAAVTWSEGAGATVFGVAALQAQQGTLPEGTTGSLTTADNFLIGTAGSDTFTGAVGTLNAGDKIVDSSATDSDVLNVTSAASAAATIMNVENINYNWDSIASLAFDATNVAGATITASSSKFGFIGTATVTALGTNDFVAGAGLTGALTVTGISSATVDAGNSTGAISVDGTATASAVDTATVIINKATQTVTNGTALEEITLAPTVDSTITMNVITDKATVSGTKNVVLKSTGLTTETVVNALTGGATLTVDSTGTAAAVDLSKVQATTYKISGAPGANAVTVPTGANVYVNVDLGDATSSIAAAAATATTNTASVTVDKDQTGLVLTNLKTTTITATADQATGAASAVDLTFAVLNAGTNNVVLNGANDVQVTAGTAKSFDATGLTGGLTYTQAAAAATTVTGGTGDNTVTLVGTTQTSTYNGQAGKDTVTATALTTGNLTADLGNGDNTITVTSEANATADTVVTVASGSGKDAITIAADLGTVTVASGAGNDTLTMSALTGAQVSADLGDGTDTFVLGATTITGNVVVDGGAGTDTLKVANSTSLAGATLTLANFEGITLTGAGTATFDAAQLTGQAYSLKGTGAITDGAFTDKITVSTSTAGSYDFSGLTIDTTLTAGLKGLAITGNSGNDTIVGTEGNDTIATNGGKDTVTGGLGKDVITGGAGVDTIVIATADTGITIATADAVASFTTTSDKLKLGVAATAANYTEIEGVDADTLADALADANNAMDGTVKYVFIYGVDEDVATGGADAADGLLFIDADMDGAADDMIVLTGAGTAAFLAYGDIIA